MVSLLPLERLGLVVTWRISLSIKETCNRSDRKGRPETTTVNSVIVVNSFISFHFISSLLQTVTFPHVISALAVINCYALCSPSKLFVIPHVHMLRLETTPPRYQIL
jgi:hypothetical protein